MNKQMDATTSLNGTAQRVLRHMESLPEEGSRKIR